MSVPLPPQLGQHAPNDVLPLDPPSATLIRSNALRRLDFMPRRAPGKDGDVLPKRSPERWIGRPEQGHGGSAQRSGKMGDSRIIANVALDMHENRRQLEQIDTNKRVHAN